MRFAIILGPVMFTHTPRNHDAAQNMQSVANQPSVCLWLVTEL